MPEKSTVKQMREEKELVSTLRGLDRTLRSLPREHDLFFHPGKHLFFTFVKGIVSGLGLITAVAIVIPIVVSLLRGIQWVPLIGDFVSRIATQVEQAQRP